MNRVGFDASFVCFLFSSSASSRGGLEQTFCCQDRVKLLNVWSGSLPLFRGHSSFRWNASSPTFPFFCSTQLWWCIFSFSLVPLAAADSSDTVVLYFLYSPVEMNQKLAYVLFETNIVNTSFTFYCTNILCLHLLLDCVSVLSCLFFSCQLAKGVRSPVSTHTWAQVTSRSLKVRWRTLFSLSLSATAALSLLGRLFTSFRIIFQKSILWDRIPMIDKRDLALSLRSDLFQTRAIGSMRSGPCFVRRSFAWASKHFKLNCAYHYWALYTSTC